LRSPAMIRLVSMTSFIKFVLQVLTGNFVSCHYQE
jgi:hypothetical protein